MRGWTAREGSTDKAPPCPAEDLLEPAYCRTAPTSKRLPFCLPMRPATAFPPRRRIATRTSPGNPFRQRRSRLIVHPRNPYVPTAHMNLRFFLVGTKDPLWYFGGGFDLTPFYPFTEDVVHWHRSAYDACRGHGNVYARLKANCDAYFYLPHRNEARGVGGIFFRRLDRGRIRRQPGLRGQRRQALPAGVLPYIRAAQQDPLGPTRRRLHAISTGTLRGIQPGRGPRYALRPSVRSKRGIGAGLFTATGTVDLRLQATSRLGGSGALTERFLSPRNWLELVDKSGD